MKSKNTAPRHNWRHHEGTNRTHPSTLDVANATIAQLRAAIEARDAAVREYLVSSDAIVRFDAGEPCTVAEAEAMLARWIAARTALVALTGGAA